MINGKEKWLWVLSAVVLVILFLASSTNLLIKEGKKVVHPISIIVGNMTDDNYVNFRKGMDRAALELHADVRFITLYSEGNWPQQLELIQREERDGAQALVIAPADAQAASSVLTRQRVHVPIVFLNGDMRSADQVDACNLTFDYFDLGRQTGEAIVRNHGTGTEVRLLGLQKQDAVSETYRDGLLSALEQAGCIITRHHWNPDKEGSFAAAVEHMAQENGEPVVIAALDSQTLLKVADVRADEADGLLEIAGLYGRGTAVPILNHLDRGRITGLCITDDFTAGYLSVKTAVDRIGNMVTEESITLDSAYIEQDDLRRSEYEKMLYPIE